MSECRVARNVRLLMLRDGRTDDAARVAEAASGSVYQRMTPPQRLGALRDALA